MTKNAARARKLIYCGAIATTAPLLNKKVPKTEHLILPIFKFILVSNIESLTKTKLSVLVFPGAMKNSHELSI